MPNVATELKLEASKSWLLLTASLVSSLITLDSTIVAVSQPAIAGALKFIGADICLPIFSPATLSSLCNCPRP